MPRERNWLGEFLGPQCSEQVSQFGHMFSFHNLWPAQGIRKVCPFLRTKLPYLLPPHESMQANESMLTALKEALGKDRHVRSKATMTTSRERMPHSLDVLREWRSRRESINVKKLFPSSTPGESRFRLDEGLFVKLPNYLIVEIILAMLSVLALSRECLQEKF